MGFWDFNAPRSSFKVPASATPNEIDCESVQKRVWFSEWVVTSSQESRNPSSSGNCCFSSGEEFSSTKNKQNEVGEAMRSSSKQNKNIKLWDIPEVTSFLTNLSLCGQLHWAWPKLVILWQKASEFTVLGLKTFLDVIERPKSKETFLAVWTL